MRESEIILKWTSPRQSVSNIKMNQVSLLQVTAYTTRSHQIRRKWMAWEPTGVWLSRYTTISKWWHSNAARCCQCKCLQIFGLSWLVAEWDFVDGWHTIYINACLNSTRGRRRSSDKQHWRHKIPSHWGVDSTQRSRWTPEAFNLIEINLPHSLKLQTKNFFSFTLLLNHVKLYWRSNLHWHPSSLPARQRHRPWLQRRLCIWCISKLSICHYFCLR